MNPSSPETTSERMPALPLKRLIVTVVFGAFLLLQITIPIVQAAGEQPARFSWQMFANRRSQPTYTVVRADDSLQSIDMRDHLAAERIELDYGDRVAPYLCRTISDAIAVRERTPDGRQVVESSCS